MVETTSAEEFGKFFGLLFWTAIAIFVIAKQAFKIKKDTCRSRYASWGLILFWVGATFLIIIGFVKTQIPQESQFIDIMISLTWFTIQLTSIILSVIGFFQTLGSKLSRKTGRTAAVTSLILGGLLVSSVTLTLYKKLNPTSHSAFTAPVEGSEFTVKRAEFNYHFELPDSTWRKANYEKQNPIIDVSYSSEFHNAAIFIIAENLGTATFDTTEPEEVIRTKATEGLKQIRFGDFHDATLNDRNYRQLDLIGFKNGYRMEYRNHLFYEEGVLYQVVITFFTPDALEKNQKLVSDLINSFQLMDPNYLQTLRKEKHVSEISVPRLGIDIELKDPNWLKWDSMATDFPYAEKGAKYLDVGAISVLGVWDIEDYDNIDAMNEAVLSRMGISDSDRKTLQIEPSTLNGHPANDLRYIDEVDGTKYQNWVRVCITENVAVAIVGWWTIGTDSTSYKEAFDSARFDSSLALAPSKFTQAQEKSQGLMINAIGLYHYNRDRFTYSLSRFKDAYDIYKDDSVILKNYCTAAQNAESYELTIPYILEHIDNHKDDTELYVDFAFLLAESGDLKQASDRLEALFYDGYVNDDDLLSYLNYMIDQDREADAAPLMLKIIEDNPKVKYKCWMASVYRIGDMIDEAEAILKDIKLDEKTNQLVFEEKVRILLARDSATEALELISLWREHMPEDYDAYILTTEAYMQLNWHVKAQEEITRALEVFEGDSELLDYENHIQSVAGKDDLSLIEKEILPISMPKRITTILETADNEKTPDEWLTKLAYYNYRTTGYFFEEGKQSKQTFKNKVTLLTRSAVERFSTLTFDFDRSAERIYVNEVIVRDETGKVVATEDRNHFYVAEQSDSEMATDEMTMYVPINGLSIGSTLEWQVSVENLGTSDTFSFTRKYLYPSYPAKEQFVYVVGDVDQIKAEPFKVESITSEAEDTLIWAKPNHAGIQTERYMPSYDQYLPHIELGSSKEEWNQIVNEYLESIDAYLVPEEAIKPIFDEAKIKTKNINEVVYELARYAQKRVVYKALEFGSRGRIPRLASDTWKNRYGDCKDQTILMLQLLKAANIDSYPLLISTEDNLVENIPSMDQFNHMVLYIPDLEPNPVIDLVDTNFDFTYGPPQGLGGISGIVCKKDGYQIYTVPDYPNDSSTPVAKVHCDLSFDTKRNKVIAEETISLSGYYGKWKRNTFLDINRDRHSAKIKDDLLSYLPDGTQFINASISHLEPPTVDLEITVKYEFDLNEESKLFTPGWEAYYLDMTPNSERKMPYRISYPFCLESTVSTDNEALEQQSNQANKENKELLIQVFSNSTEDTINNQSSSKTRVNWNAVVLSPTEYYKFHDELSAARALSKRTLIPVETKAIATNGEITTTTQN
ncbi:MAG: DUF3857 domain-containing protein [Opitutaceae bacterium]